MDVFGCTAVVHWRTFAKSIRPRERFPDQEISGISRSGNFREKKPYDSSRAFERGETRLATFDENGTPTVTDSSGKEIAENGSFRDASRQQMKVEIEVPDRLWAEFVLTMEAAGMSVEQALRAILTGAVLGFENSCDQAIADLKERVYSNPQLVARLNHLLSLD
jgi:hypothetical protein